ncbi:MAG: hypothetical protein QNK37_27310 [Acidobacteriota bacterium]|nr:hypothetical protein [Acidobacteriota bacterium]
MSYRQIYKGYLRQIWCVRIFNVAALLFYAFAVAFGYLDAIANLKRQGMIVALMVLNGNLFLGFAMGFHLRCLTEGTMASMIPDFRKKHLLAMLSIALPFVLVPPVLITLSGLDHGGLGFILFPPLVFTLWCSYRFGFALTIVPIMSSILAVYSIESWLAPFSRVLDLWVACGLNLIAVLGCWLFVRKMRHEREGEKAIVIAGETMAKMPGGWRWGQITPFARMMLQPTLDRFRNSHARTTWEMADRLELGLASPAFRAGTLPIIFVLINLMVIGMHYVMGVAQKLQEVGQMDVYAHIAYLTCGISASMDLLQNRPSLQISWLHAATANRAQWVKAVHLAYLRVMVRLFLWTNLWLLVIHLFLPLFTLQSFFTSLLFGGVFLGLFTAIAVSLMGRLKKRGGIEWIFGLFGITVVYIVFMVFYVYLVKSEQSLMPLYQIILAAILIIILIIRAGMRAWMRMDLDLPPIDPVQ